MKPQTSRALFGLTAVTSLADGLVLVAVPLSAARASSNNVTVVAAIVSLTWLPGIAATLGSARSIGAHGSRAVLTAVQSARATVLLLPFAVSVVSSSGWFLVVLATAAVVANGSELAVDNTIEVIAGESVARERYLGLFGSLRSVQLTFNRFIGPILGALAFQLVSYWMFTFAALVYGGSLLFVRRTPDRPPSNASSSPATLRASLRLTVSDSVLRLSLLLLATLALSVGLTSSVLAVFVAEALEAPPSVFGWIIGANALGGVAAGLVAPKLSKGDLVSPLVIGFFFTAIGQGVFGVATNLPTALAAGTIFGAAATIAGVTVVALRQSMVEDNQRAHIGSVFRVSAAACLPAGALLGGLAANTLGLRSPWLIGAAVQVVALVALLPSVRTIRRSYVTGSLNGVHQIP